MRLGETFLMPIPHQDIVHLWIVLSDPDQFGGAYVIANVTKDAARSGGECPLSSADHPWIKTNCFLNLADAMEITGANSANIEALVGKLIEMQARLETKVLERLVEIAKKSRAIPVRFKRYL
jgi:hypothetical protein